MSLRLLQFDEAHKMAEIGEMFFRESHQPGVLNMGHFVATWMRGISNGDHFVLALDDEASGRLLAILGATIAVCPNTGDIIAAENFFYALPEAKGRTLGMIAEFEKEAKSRGVKRVWMMHLHEIDEDGKAERIGRWYERRGYQRRETCYMKGI